MYSSFICWVAIDEANWVAWKLSPETTAKSKWINYGPGAGFSVLSLKITCLEAHVNSCHWAGKDAPLRIQCSQVARVAVQHSEMTIQTFDIGRVKGAHGGANILVNIWSAVVPVHIFVPVASGQVSRRNHSCCKCPACSCCGKVCNEKMNPSFSSSLFPMGLLARLNWYVQGGVRGERVGPSTGWRVSEIAVGVVHEQNFTFQWFFRVCDAASQSSIWAIPIPNGHRFVEKPWPRWGDNIWDSDVRYN